MRILHALHSFPPESHGGVETYVQMLAAGQMALGHDVDVLAGSERNGSAANGPDQVGGVAITRLRSAGQLQHPLGQLHASAREQLADLLDPERIDLLHVHHWHNLAGDLVRTARRRGLTVLVTLHDLYTSCPLFFRVPEPGVLCAPDLPRADCVRCVGRFVDLPAERLSEGLVERELGFHDELQEAHAVLALSAAQRDLLAQVPWLAGVPIRVLPLPRPEVPAPRAAWHPGGNGLRIVTWGGLVPAKGLHVLLEACEQLTFAEHVTLDHHGRVLDAGYAEQLQRRARRVRLTLHGAYGARELAHCFPAYDLMVFPSLYLETHGFVVDEAMALGLPVVVTDRGAPRERVGARGAVVPVGDASALARLLAELHAHPERLLAMRGSEPPAQPSLDEHLAALMAIAAEASGR